MFCLFLTLLKSGSETVPQREKEILRLMTLMLNGRPTKLPSSAHSLFSVLTSRPLLRQIYLVCASNFLHAVTSQYSSSLNSSVLMGSCGNTAFLIKTKVDKPYLIGNCFSLQGHSSGSAEQLRRSCSWTVESWIATKSAHRFN